MLPFLRTRRRNRLRATPLPDAWWSIIDRRIPLVASLPPQAREELAGIIQILLAEKQFIGAGGLEITDEIRVTIAAQAAILILGRDTRYYPTLKTIYVYPRAYAATAARQNPDGTVTEGFQPRRGESWHKGAVVLSWSDVVHGAADASDGRNVTLHEFAHQLDSEWGGMEGAPLLPSPARYRDWARVLEAEYHALMVDLHHGYRTLLDPYASTNPAEFFAVATEFFFERPTEMRSQHPELYEQLAAFYQQDPAPRE